MKGRSIFSIAATEKEIHRLRGLRRDVIFQSNWEVGKDAEKKVALELPAESDVSGQTPVGLDG